MNKNIPFETLKGLKLESVTAVRDKHNDCTVQFVCEGGRKFELCHDFDCCESVYLADVCGDLTDLVGEVLEAEETGREAEKNECAESGTWTFYHIRTALGTVTLRWLGESNGYYSESVDFREIT